MKIVMVVNKELPLGLIANTTAVLGITLGKVRQEIVGDDCVDTDNQIHKGITKTTVPVLATDGDGLKQIYRKCSEADKVELIDFNRIAQSCRDYEEYKSKLAKANTEKIDFSGLCLYGNPKQIDRITGSLGLLK